jgi:hypothetical protein
MRDNEPWNRQYPLADVDHQGIGFICCLLHGMRQEIRDSATHHQLQDDLGYHMWMVKKRSSLFEIS